VFGLRFRSLFFYFCLNTKVTKSQGCKAFAKKYRKAFISPATGAASSFIGYRSFALARLLLCKLFLCK